MNHVDYSAVTSLQGIKEYIGTHKTVAFDFETAPDEPYRDDEKAALDPWRSHTLARLDV